jgi:cytoskeletal protein CcmA (bactofilin family)
MKAAKKPNYERPSTVIGKDTIIETMNLKSKSSVQINGVLNGDTDVEASLVVGQGGKVVGNIKALFILVAGTIEGNVEAVEQLHVTKSAAIHGDITCGSIVIDDGAILNGSCKMKTPITNNDKDTKTKTKSKTL